MCALSGKLAMDDAGSDGESSQQSGGGSYRGFKSQLDKALTARQEAEAKMTTLEDKVKQYEAENVELKQKVNAFNSRLSHSCTHWLNHLSIIVGP